MPKGQWDRSKTKEQRDAEKAAAKAGEKKGTKAAPKAAAAPKAKAAKPVKAKAAPAKKTASAPTAAPKAKAEGQGVVHAPNVAALDATFAMSQVNNNLSVLNGLYGALSGSELAGKVAAEISAHLDVLSTLREKAFASTVAPAAVEAAPVAEETTPVETEAGNGVTSVPAIPPAPATAAPAWQPPPPAQG